jgi:hypothetical protein
LSSVKRCNKIKREHTNLRIVLLPYMMYLFLQSFRHLLRVGGIGKKAPSTFVDNAQQLVPVGGVGTYLVRSTSIDVECGVCAAGITSPVSSCL